jgi:hypothetical protein
LRGDQMHNTDIQALSGPWSNDPVVYVRRGSGTA